MQTLSAAKIDVYQHLGVGSFRDVVEKFTREELTKIAGLSVQAHDGMGPGRGFGGQGRGRGGGFGGGSGGKGQ